MTENEFMLQDRLAKIRATYEQLDLEHTGFIGFSGGKDSTVLSYMFDMAVPNNKLPRVFCNTGLEMTAIIEFVKEMQSKDERVVIEPCGCNMKDILEEKGYPFKSKMHSEYVHLRQINSTAKSVERYFNPLTDSLFKCPLKLMYQGSDFSLKISDMCCYYAKKRPVNNYRKRTGRQWDVVGLRMSEGGARNKSSVCISETKHRFSPLLTCDDGFIKYMIERYKIRIANVYYPPFCFERTGCVGCPYDLHLRESLDKLRIFFPQDYKRAINTFGKVYNEYARIGYRRVTQAFLQGKIE